MSDIVERREFLLVKRGLYWRPDSSGYTGIKAHAGLYLASDASPETGTTAVHKNDAPQFADGCWPEIAQKHQADIITDLLASLEELLAPLEAASAAFDRTRAAIAKAKGGAS